MDGILSNDQLGTEESAAAVVEASPRNKGGRPRGGHNKPKVVAETEEKLKKLYQKFSPYLTKEQREYVAGVLSGEQPVDTVREMELLVRQMALLFQESASWFFQEGRINQDIGKFADSLRMSIKDLHDMQTKKEEKEAKAQQNDELVQLASQRPEMERLTAILGNNAEGRTTEDN